MISNADDTQTLKGGKDGQVDRGGAGSRASGAQIRHPSCSSSVAGFQLASLSDDETLVYGNCFSYLHLSYGAFSTVTASYVASTN